MKNIWVRIASIGMTTAAALSTGGITNVLAGTDTALKGASEAIDTEAWNNKGPELLIDAMRSQRAKQEVEIYASLTKDTTEYPLSAGLRDLAKYRNIGFVTRALTDLAKDTAQRAKDDEQEAKSAKADPRSALQKLQNLQ
jgi:ethanolamine utilization protein EutP (predicted NTPase)